MSDTTEIVDQRFPKLKAAFAVGGTMELFPLLADWSRDDLRALLAEIDAVWDLSEEEYGRLSLLPQNFFSRVRSDRLDESRMEITALLSEICSVAQLYIGE